MVEITDGGKLLIAGLEDGETTYSRELARCQDVQGFSMATKTT